MPKPSTLHTHLSNTSPPWSCLLVVPHGSSASAAVKAPTGFVMRTIEGKKCKTSSTLFTEFARALTFPEYFGHNWDALEECLADFEWLPAKGYILLITDAHAVLPHDEEEYETLLEILNDAGEAWSKGQTADGRRAPFHALFVVSEQDRSKRKRWEMEECLCDKRSATNTRARPKRPAKASPK